MVRVDDSQARNLVLVLGQISDIFFIIFILLNSFNQARIMKKIQIFLFTFFPAGKIRNKLVFKTIQWTALVIFKDSHQRTVIAV